MEFPGRKMVVNRNVMARIRYNTYIVTFYYAYRIFTPRVSTSNKALERLYHMTKNLPKAL